MAQARGCALLLGINRAAITAIAAGRERAVGLGSVLALIRHHSTATMLGHVESALQGAVRHALHVDPVIAKGIRQDIVRIGDIAKRTDGNPSPGPKGLVL